MASKDTSMPGRLDRRKSSTLHYQTFPTPPPKSRGRPPVSPAGSSGNPDGSSNPLNHGAGDDEDQSSPLPTRQLAILAVIALAEQTALNSISPYLPEMTSTFPEVDVQSLGLYVGIIGSSFALAQFATNFFWGWLSDKIGRKPVVMLGTILTAACFLAFGFCRTLWQAVLVQALMGLVNGNQGVISTCLGEITDRSNQSKAFVYLPVIYGIGGITGPALGGLLVKQGAPYPFLLPNLFSASILIVDLILTGIFLEESLEQAKDLPPLQVRAKNLFSWIWQFAGGARRPTYLKRHIRRHSRHRVDGAMDEPSEDSASDNASETQSLMSIPELFPHNEGHLGKEVLNRNTILLLGTYLVFQLSNISFNVLYPIFAESPAPTGRELKTAEIGLSLSFAGIITIIFQVGIFGKLKEKMGNKSTYRAGLFLFFISMMLMPWVGYRDSPAPFGWGSGVTWLWIEIGAILLLKTVAAVGGLTSALLLITNSAPNHSVLGTLNGLAQTLSAAGRALGPFLSGGLFSLSTQIHPKGEALAWGTFGGIAFLGWLFSFGIRGEELEDADWEGSESHDEEEDTDEDLENGAGR
ncbi:MFS general substrate transporter [Glarea lozoyensis ATCC 20868]|uniref:MFS general substrate transporter n=1 Tax=Glarea lozoyensis (strain ATCC 20868 / MF5171) TaxID=1116229 RepID=S3D3R1_GLAL2|nr:MFS general substrate transporter [Glarea lozoyensis ATCC 20868]EPE26696.1 MFS general substrate transporter [Glarea lozoyensis ATCC 20868]